MLAFVTDADRVGPGGYPQWPCDLGQQIVSGRGLGTQEELAEPDGPSWCWLRGTRVASRIIASWSTGVGSTPRTRRQPATQAS
jgi:hypothetical protein